MEASQLEISSPSEKERRRALRTDLRTRQHALALLYCLAFPKQPSTAVPPGVLEAECREIILDKGRWRRGDEGEHFEDEGEIKMRVDILLNKRRQLGWKLFQGDFGGFVLLVLLPSNEVILRKGVIVYEVPELLLRSAEEERT